MTRFFHRPSLLAALLLPAAFALQDDDVTGSDILVYPDPPQGLPPVLPVAGADAADEASMGAYDELVPGTELSFRMQPIPGGEFVMGSPAEEDDRRSDEGPQAQVRLSPFWMGTHEVTWGEYHAYIYKLDIQRRGDDPERSIEQDAWADAVSRPTPMYVPMDFDMGVDGYPAICMTQFGAKQYCKWLSMKTGRFYRLPTEAEWEYACRAGTTTAYSFGDDPDDLDDYAWYFDNADDTYQKVGTKKPNPWGLFDMHGNVAEWVLDAHDKVHYTTLGEEVAIDPVRWPDELYPRVVRGGSWDDDPEDLRSATRRGSKAGWKVQDPQLPKSIWYHTDAKFVGFRVVRPLVEPPLEERARYWEADLDDVREIQERQRRGDR